jgi:hypothetical protein
MTLKQYTLNIVYYQALKNPRGGLHFAGFMLFNAGAFKMH